MAETPPNGMPTLYPSMSYRNAPAAIDWLKRAFGFEEMLVVPGDAGREVAHAELRFGTGVMMLGSPRPGEPEGAQNTPYAYVADVDAHAARARAAGAEITMEPHDNDYGGRGYGVKDLEGNIWYFGSYVPEGTMK